MLNAGSAPSTVDGRMYNRRMKKLMIVVFALALACALLLCGCGSKPSPEASPEAGPEKTVTDFMVAFGQKDMNSVMSLLDPDTVSKMEQYVQNSGGDLQTLIAGEMSSVIPAGSSDVQFSNLKFNTTINGDAASVEVVSADVTYRDSQGNMQSKHLSGSSSLVRKNDNWYIESINVE